MNSAPLVIDLETPAVMQCHAGLSYTGWAKNFSICFCSNYVKVLPN